MTGSSAICDLLSSLRLSRILVTMGADDTPALSAISPRALPRPLVPPPPALSPATTLERRLAPSYTPIITIGVGGGLGTPRARAPPPPPRPPPTPTPTPTRTPRPPPTPRTTRAGERPNATAPFECSATMARPVVAMALLALAILVVVLVVVVVVVVVVRAIVPPVLPPYLLLSFSPSLLLSFSPSLLLSSFPLRREEEGSVAVSSAFL
eukprot:CAMPEP_0119479980 /NCGR_PEP_ID=MMETSP1344-20130328/9003_1 /TAXON_ID=236787 /ORGANISM="Florenciella parvula, Strain CCMP2471" /LENGTH=208 /DNA_ID=CAMNT_0007514259 /DNA_START=410 /DNA_END=1032 /DNA_ORIENTATION=+